MDKIIQGEFATRENMAQKTRVTVPYAETKEDFLYIIGDNTDWIITTDKELRVLGDDEFREDYDCEVEFFLGTSFPGSTTGWLRAFCREHHPEIDFDVEFETNKPGVFARYQERFGHDYEDWVSQAKYEALKSELSKRGYELPWD